MDHYLSILGWASLGVHFCQFNLLRKNKPKKGDLCAFTRMTIVSSLLIIIIILVIIIHFF